ncbi:MAG: hypothetical protein Q9160_006338 [Pyrenula sp. 1 TL-2023]
MSASPIQVDPYQTLGVPKTADLAAIRTAHRKLVLKHHPDRIKDPTEREKSRDVFHKVQTSYEILSDDNRRNRYDQEVKLAELRKEQLMKDSVRPSSYSVRANTGSSHDYRDGHVVVDAAPRFFDDDRSYVEEPRTSSRKHQNYDRHDRHDRYEKSDRYERYEREQYREKDRERERKSSTAYAERKSSKSSSGLSATIEKKIRQSAKVAREKVESKSRDKERKRETSDKYSSRRAYVEDDDSSSDSDTIVPQSRRPAPPKRAATYDERSRPSKGETPRRREEKRSTREEEYSDEWDAHRAYKHEDYHTNAREYIDRSRNRPKIYRTKEDAHYWHPRDSEWPTGRRGASDREGLRSGSDRDDRWDDHPKSSKSRRPSIEVVESAPRTIPSMPKHTSAPGNLKIPSDRRGAPMPQRSATAQVPRDHRREMPLPRSNTTPLAGMTSSRKNDSVPSKSSKLRHGETQDSGYGSSSPNTPEHYGTSPPKSSKHVIVDEDEELSRPHIVSVDPEEIGPRDVSPPRERERPTRPPLSTKGGSHPKATRTTTYTYPSDDKRPNPTRQNSSRPSTTRDPPNPSRGESGRQKLFGHEGHGSVYPEEKVSFSQNYRQEDVNYASYRRHSADQRARDHVDQRSTVRVG